MVVTLRIPPIVLLVIPTILAGSCVAEDSYHVTMSMARLERMVREEKTMLKEMRDYFNYRGIGKKPTIQRFLKHQMALAVEREQTGYDEIYFKHPNSIFLIIKEFRRLYSSAVNSLGSYYEQFQDFLKDSKNVMSEDFDIAGTVWVLLVLQNIYELPAETMMKGDYLGFKGPPLEPSDAIEIGKHALGDGFLNNSLEWLNLGLALRDQNITQSQHSEGHIKALIGHVFLQNNDITKAMDLYKEALILDPSDNEVAMLGRNIQKGITINTAYLKQFNEDLELIKPLCSLGHGLHTGDPKSSKNFCRYREALLPYYRYKEEILSLVPLVSVVYNFTTDCEVQTLKALVKDQLKVATIGNGRLSLTRTGVFGLVTEDEESDKSVRLGERLELLTGLDARKASPSHTISELIQVINYGFGGYYLSHIDAEEPYEEDRKKDSSPRDTRVLTCLVYLNDVEKGGATVFPKLNISVFPIKNMALMWYNLNPAGEIERDSLHAGCPVAVGHKWIANKWIWTPGSLHRRCGLSVNATNLEMELEMKRGYR